MSTITPPASRTSTGRPTSRQTVGCLGRYTDPRGHQRELVCAPGARGSTLVIDRLAGTVADERLVAHLAADEPEENARIVADVYLADKDGRHCRRLIPDDLVTGPFETQTIPATGASANLMEASGGELTDINGCLYTLQAGCNGGSIPELRWWRQPPERDALLEVVTVREVIGSLHSYEPVRARTARALAAHLPDRRISTGALRAELDRVNASPIVLNGGLREAVLAAVGEGLSLSEIAIRCGRFKRDANGRESGETSWLARRIGTLPEGGADTPTPWVSSDVLALIARQGLGVSPREVELG